MGISNVIKKAYKAIGDSSLIKEVLSNPNVAPGAESIGDAAKKVGKGAKSIAGELFTAKTIDPDDTDFIKLPWKMKTKYAVGIPLAVASIGAVTDFQEANDRMKHGEIYGSSMANTMNHTYSDTLQKEAQFAKNKPTEYNAQTRRENHSLRSNEATGDLVLALHQLRSGGQ